MKCAAQQLYKFSGNNAAYFFGRSASPNRRSRSRVKLFLACERGTVSTFFNVAFSCCSSNRPDSSILTWKQQKKGTRKKWIIMKHTQAMREQAVVNVMIKEFWDQKSVLEVQQVFSRHFNVVRHHQWTEENWMSYGIWNFRKSVLNVQTILASCHFLTWNTSNMWKGIYWLRQHIDYVLRSMSKAYLC